jgi:hypothetical protein
MNKGDHRATLDLYRDSASAVSATGDHAGASVIAHMAGVAETDDAERLNWDLLALREADAAVDRDDVRGFYPSLYNNLAYSHIKLGDRDEALRCLRLAWSHGGALEPGAYGDRVRATIRSRLDELENKP